MYLPAYDSVIAAKVDITQFIDEYNTMWLHSSLADKTPDPTYWSLLLTLAMIA